MIASNSEGMSNEKDRVRPQGESRVLRQQGIPACVDDAMMSHLGARLFRRGWASWRAGYGSDWIRLWRATRPASRRLTLKRRSGWQKLPLAKPCCTPLGEHSSRIATTWLQTFTVAFLDARSSSVLGSPRAMSVQDVIGIFTGGSPPNSTCTARIHFSHNHPDLNFSF